MNLAFFLILIFVVCGLLQVFLSKRGGTWAGLILPIFSFAVSLLFVYSVATSGYWARDVLTVGGSLLLFNLPTGVFLAIYVVYRRAQMRQRALEKMSIQDLE